MPQEIHADVLVIEEIPKDIPTDESVPADESAPAEENASAKETARTDTAPAPEEKISSPKSSKVKKMVPSASDVKKTKDAEKEAKKRKGSSTPESSEAKRLKTLDENAQLDVVPLKVAPSYTMIPFESEDKENPIDEEMKNVDSEEHTDEEFQIDDIPQSFIPLKTPEEPAQGSAATAKEFGSSSKQIPQAKENQGEDPQSEENPNPEQDPQPEVQAKENTHPEQNPQPEAQADEIPQFEEHAEENALAPNTETAIVVVNTETAMIVSPQEKKQNLQPMQNQPFSKRPKFQKKSFYEEQHAGKMYDERELPNKMMEVLMKPLAKDQPPRMTFLVQDLKYEPRTVYRILCSVIAPIKGHDDEDVVGIMKNILFNIIHGIPINLHDFFLRTLADNVMSPFDLKIYAPWIIRFIRHRSGINYHADFNNHIGYMPPIRVKKKTFEPVEGKGKSVIDEGSRPLDGQFREPDAYSSWDDAETQEPPSPVAPRVMTKTELHLSLHQKVDRNHKWVKRQLRAIVKTLNETQNAVKINRHYLHEVFDRTWATLAHLKPQQELDELEFTQDFDWSWPPKKKFKPIPVRDLEDSSFSSFRMQNVM
ncbi:hypothetical protein ZWY2020_048450 [Hordeum vulgare]|nr:hypothetical protein ZWY2020_048450 [Hordeum vulgare]